MPAREMADGILVLAGGILMLSPGFVLDVVGLLLVLPFTRPLARKGLTAFVAARMVGDLPFGGTARHGTGGDGTTYRRNDDRHRPGSGGTVGEGEVEAAESSSVTRLKSSSSCPWRGAGERGRSLIHTAA